MKTLAECLYYELDVHGNKNKLTQQELIDMLVSYAYTNKDIETIYSINDALYWYGYSYKFKYKNDEDEGEEFKYSEYHNLIKGKKNINKTYELVNMLSNLNHFIISINSLQFMKVKFINELLLFINDDLMEKFYDYSVYDLYMMCLSNKYDDLLLNQKEVVKENIEAFFERIGIRYLDTIDMKFRLDMEYLLWTINKNDKAKDSYLKINTIKVGLSIAPKELFVWDNKKYYNEEIHKNLVKYLSFIDKDEAKRIYLKYNEFIDDTHIIANTGYKVLFNLI